MSSEGRTISSFRRDSPHFFLSNFAAVWVMMTYDEVTPYVYPTVEHAYQACKTLDPAMRARIQALSSPAAAKRLGNELVLRPDWTEDFRIKLMKDLLWQKFNKEPYRRLLLLTGDAILVEGNKHHDNFWGDCVCGRAACYPMGKNNLGLLLQQVRFALKQIESGVPRSAVFV